MTGPSERLFLREKPFLAILAVGELQPAYAALVAKRIDSTFPHTSSILSQMEAQGLISSRPEGRVRYLELTDRGRRVVRTLQELSDLLKEPDAKWQKLERLRQLIAEENGPGAELRLGPLRRDLAGFRGQKDEELQRAAQELDDLIVAALGRDLGPAIGP